MCLSCKPHCLCVVASQRTAMHALHEQLSSLSRQRQIWLVCLNVLNTWFAQSTSKFWLPFTNALHELFSWWICDRNPDQLWKAFTGLKENSFHLCLHVLRKMSLKNVFEVQEALRYNCRWIIKTSSASSSSSCHPLHLYRISHLHKYCE